MAHHYFSRVSIRIGGVLLLAALLVLGMFALVAPVKAQQVQRILHPPIHGKMGYVLRMSLINAGQRSVEVQFHALDGTNLSRMASSNPIVLGARTGSFFEVTLTSEAFVAPALEIIGAPRSRPFVFSIQLFDETGQTVAFAGDGLGSSHSVRLTK